MRTHILVLSGAVLALAPASVSSQEFDIQLMMKWADTQVVAYAVTGVYRGQVNVAHKDISGQVADVTDRVSVDLTWNVRNRAIVGKAKVQNTVSATSNVRNLVASCPPPRLNGTYEYFELTAVSASGQERVDLAGTRTYPAVDLTDCTGATEKRTVKGAQEKTVVYLPIPDPMILAMPAMTTGGQVKFNVAKDKKSFSLEVDGWTWTYVPTRIS